ncbi:MAG: Glycerol transport-related protein GlpU [uncultured Craurococcus sp.]|jgi:predicted small integral membrane protein|uniref:Glycerol transport-related protein GlpU n=1 Tax=uncultured Craurococcus sp. TaxID=1135998 RepID=A0A6J4I7L0_9PROT|nr:MAG: Glycerol transport-related protein GlpU [uncultured Craurococcus sp.]
MALSWMAWTWQTALFFSGLLAVLAVMTTLAALRPERDRIGMLGLPTTRGDRLFLTLLGSAFIHLGWLALAGDAPLWGASIVSVVYGAILFRWA